MSKLVGVFDEVMLRIVAYTVGLVDFLKCSSIRDSELLTAVGCQHISSQVMGSYYVIAFRRYRNMNMILESVVVVASMKRCSARSLV